VNFFSDSIFKQPQPSLRANGSREYAPDDRLCEEAIETPSFRDGPQDQTRNLEIPGSMLRIAPE
jgi:hypothetical protein